MTEKESRVLLVDVLNAMTALVRALEAKDRYISGHSQRVSEMCAAIAELKRKKGLQFDPDVVDAGAKIGKLLAARTV
jgi:HD-GYP domain-containing protein (c-di-GMP phosphodiesterase class II)